jgi:predicted outer membrane repeat protein
MCRVPHGDSDERYGYPLIVPRIGTRALVPKNFGTSTGGAIAATTPASFPSIFAWNRSSCFAITILRNLQPAKL